MVKTDAGPGRLAKEADSIEFREDMANMGVYIILSLPNGTECQAELDQMFSDFQPRCKRSAIRIVGMKIKSRLEDLKRAGAAEPPISVDSDSSSSNEESGDENDGELSVVGDVATAARRETSITKVKLSNLDLGHVINGFPGDPVELRPFDYCFTQEKIIKTWIKVGFMPHTGNAALDPKVRHEMGDGGAPEEQRVRMEQLVEDYEKSAQRLTELGFNGAVLDLKPKTVSANSSALTRNEDELVEEIMSKGLVSKAGGLFKAGVIIANCRVVTAAARRGEALKHQAEADAVQKHEAKAKSDLSSARDAYRRWEDKGRKQTVDGDPDIKSKKDAIAIIRVLLPRLSVGPKKVTLTSFKVLKDCLQWLGDIRRGTSWHEELEALFFEVDDETYGAVEVDGAEGTAD